jgi:hypothetical protein
MGLPEAISPPDPALQSPGYSWLVAFFDKLFSRRPRLPDPVHDPFGGDVAVRSALEGLKQGDWRAADELLAATRKGDDRAARAGHMVAAADGWPDWIDRWHAERNDRSEPWLIRGALRIGEAWKARGSGRADDVDDDAWPVFFERLGEAEADLREAILRDETDAIPWAYLLITGSALDQEVTELRERFNEAQRRDPQGWLAPWQALNALSEKWCGSHDIMFAFAREIGGGSPQGSQLHALIAEAHLHRWQYFSMEDPPNPREQSRYFDDGAVQKDLRRAWERGPGSPLFKPGRFANGQLALFAFAFSLGDDRDLSREAFEKLNNHLTIAPWSHLGDPVKTFVKYRDWALA